MFSRECNSAESSDDDRPVDRQRGPQQQRPSADARMSLEALRAEQMESQHIGMHRTRFKDGLVSKVSAYYVQSIQGSRWGSLCRGLSSACRM